jgi:hypothetical protein
MRIPDPTSFVPSLVRVGWATTRRANPDPGSARAHVFFFRGQAIVLSGGFGRMCDELRRRGIWAEDLRCRGERWAVRQVLADHQEGRPVAVALVGHSCGGRSAIFAAEQLNEAGVAVSLIVCLDVTLPPPVPANVRRAINLRRTRRRLYPAMPLIAAPGARPVIENIDLDAADSPIEPAWICHANITSRPRVREYVVDRIAKALEFV